MKINQIVELSLPGMYKVTPDEGSAFFIRKEYLFSIDFNAVQAGSEFTVEEDVSELLDAGLAAAVEFKAISYLARAEQCHYKLAAKLREKGYEKKYVDMALCYLEKINYLSDERFARSWLHARRINHYEGRSKLLAELQSRGIGRETAQKAVDEFFTEYDEDEIAAKAYEKFVKHGKSDEKLISSMLTAGFTYKQIKLLQDK